MEKKIHSVKMRSDESGATRSPIEGKAELFKYLSPLVLKSFGEYMLEHQTQEDGQKREGDNWKKGADSKEWNDCLPDSKLRHFLDEWLIHDGYEKESRSDEVEALNAQLFGTMARLHNILDKKYRDKYKK